MKRFSSLLDGIYYMIGCPICSKTMSYDFKGVTLATGFNHRGDVYHDFIFDLNSQDHVKVRAETGEVILEDGKSNYDYDYMKYGSSMASYLAPPANYYPIHGGVIFLTLSKSCEACCQYTYTIAIQADVQNNCVINTFLESELLTFEEQMGAIVYEIKNVYNMSQTEYRVISRKDGAPGTNKPLSLPLIPMDLSDPEAILVRIKKLAIFS